MSHCYHDDSPQFDCSARRCPYCPEAELVQPGDEGVIVDDSPAHLTATYLWEAAPRGHGHIQVAITEIE